jgi:N-methylhydantoinase B
MGTWGATSRHDGQEGVPHMASNQANVPVEMIEADYPIRIEHYGFAPDTGGAGRYRGGLGVVRDYRVLSDDVYFGVRSDKAVHAPHGLFGGADGALAVNVIHAAESRVAANHAAGDRHLPPMPMLPITLNRGEVYHHVMAGGGGYGDPLERDPDRVQSDVLDGKVSREHARSAYGVVIDADTRIDPKGTKALRATLRGARGGG